MRTFPRVPKPRQFQKLLVTSACASFFMTYGYTCRNFIAPRVENPSTVREIVRRSPEVSRKLFGDIFSTPEPPVVIKEDYSLSLFLFGVGASLCTLLPYFGFGIGFAFLLLGMILGWQTNQIRFKFSGKYFEVKAMDADHDNEPVEEDEGDLNENKWLCKNIVNVGFFPEGLVERGLSPAIVYFREVYEDAVDDDGDGELEGENHWYPCICDAQSLKYEFTKRGNIEVPV